MDAVRSLALIVATMATGLAAGVFALYAHTVMPGLARTDDRTFVTAFQAIDRAIVNPWFMVSAFGGALASTALAAVTNRGRPALPYVAAALVLYLVAVLVTIVVHVPLNDAVKAATASQLRSEPLAVRQQLDEARWVMWNLVRVAGSISALGCLCWALIVHGKSLA